MPAGMTGDCGTHETSRDRSAGERSAMLTPSTEIVPFDAVPVAIARSSVDLPAPFGPMIDSQSPRLTCRLTSEMSVVPVSYTHLTLPTILLV